ncbi:MAG TPA: hypothetical protein VJJ26_02940 [Candidatus Babeliales bacterium]|nr:hypothetical protein [Candidatus Babeliales bacterium]
MELVKYITLSHNNKDYYSYKSASNIEMSILGQFLFSEVRNDISFFKKWFFDELSDSASNNCTILEKEDGFILIRDMYSEEEEPTQLKLTYAQFLQILNDWEEKVIQLKPKEVIIKHENDQFIFETKD